MPTSMRDLLRAVAVEVTESALTVDLEDGRVLSVPLEWFPRLLDADAEQRKNVRLVGRGIGLHWPDLDEDLSVAGLLQGRRGELSVEQDDTEDADNDSPANGSPIGKYQRSEAR